MTTDQLLDHPSYNHEYALASMLFARQCASSYGLEEEVTEAFWNSIKSAFNTNDYPVTKNEYFVHAENALYDWDI